MKKVFLAVLLSMYFVGCATIVSKTTQNVGILSEPLGATVTVDNQEKGNTPLIVVLKRKNTHVVKIEMAGYKPYEIKLKKTINGWYFGNIILGGIIGLVVDAVDGAMYKLTPAHISAKLEQGETPVSQNGIYIFVTQNPDPNWVKVGNLTPIN